MRNTETDLQAKLGNGSMAGEGVKIREKPGNNRRVDRSELEPSMVSQPLKIKCQNLDTVIL